MNQDIRNLEPKALWNNFSDLNAVPRGSKKEERVIAFMVEFGKQLLIQFKMLLLKNLQPQVWRIVKQLYYNRI